MQAPRLLARFPYVDELPAAEQALDILLAFEKVYPRATKAGIDLTKFEVCSNLFSNRSLGIKLIMF